MIRAFLAMLALTAADPPAWKAVKPADGTFSAEMPAEAKVLDRDVDAPPDMLRQTIYYCKVGGALFSVQSIARPAPIAEADRRGVLDADHKAYLASGGKVVRDQRSMVDGLPAWDTTIQGPAPGGGDATVMSRVRIVLADRTTYSASVIGPPGQPLPDDAARFLDAFHLTAKASAPPKPATPVADATPEQALRTFLIATLTRDEPTLRVVALPAAEFERLLDGKPPSTAQMVAARLPLTTAPIRALKAGDEFTLPGGRKVVVPPEDVAEDRAVLLPEGNPVPTRLRRIDGHWKVDARPVIAGRKATEAARAKAKAKAGAGPEGR